MKKHKVDLFNMKSNAFRILDLNVRQILYNRLLYKPTVYKTEMQGFYIFCEKKQIFSKCGNSSIYSELCQAASSTARPEHCTVDQNFIIQCRRQESIFKSSQPSIQAYTLVYIVGFIRTPSLIGPTPFNLSFFCVSIEHGILNFLTFPACF